MSKRDPYVWISREEALMLLRSMVHARAGTDRMPISEDSAYAVIKWAEEARIAGDILAMVLEGKVNVDYDEVSREVVFVAVAEKVTA